MTVYNEDFTLADLSVMPWGEIDSVITDPPYSAYVHANTTSQSLKGGTRRNELGFESLTPELRLAIANAIAKAKRWSVVFSDFEGLHNWRDYVQIAGGTYIRAMPWCRWSMPCLAGDRPPQGAELITAYYGHGKGRKHWNGLGNHISFNHTCLRGKDKHSTEKPLDLMLDIVSWFTDPGELVLDPCVGSGTTGLACRLLGREFVGYEIDGEWAQRARERINNETLSKRDQERYERWQATQIDFNAAKARIADNTSKQRAKLDAKQVNDSNSI